MVPIRRAPAIIRNRIMKWQSSQHRDTCSRQSTKPIKFLITFEQRSATKKNKPATNNTQKAICTATKTRCRTA